MGAVALCGGRREIQITQLLVFHFSELFSKTICVQIRKGSVLLFPQTPSIPAPDSAAKNSVFCDVTPGVLGDTNECCRAKYCLPFS